MKIHELAKRYDKTTAEIKESLEGMGLTVKSHLMPVEEKYIRQLEEKYRKKPAFNPRVVLRKKQEEPKEEEVKKEPVEEISAAPEIQAPTPTPPVERFERRPVERRERRDFSGPRPDFTRTRPNFNGPRPSSTGSRPGFAGPRPGFAGPRPGFTGPRPAFGGPRPGFTNPRPDGRPGVASPTKPGPSEFTVLGGALDRTAQKRTPKDKDEKNRVSKKEREEQQVLAKLASSQAFASNSRKMNKRRKQEAFLSKQRQIEDLRMEERIIACRSELTIKELSEKMAINPTEIVKQLFLEGKAYNVNSFISREIAEKVAAKYNVIVEAEKDIEKYRDVKYDAQIEGGMPRPPVVTIMGHVDHGKTSLLDKIRSTKIAMGEAGGITQKVSAYQIEKNGKKITFIDTPGHEAFMAMRARGASVTDIAVLVVAADDGVMPQTIEALSHAQFAKVPIIVAVNKIDKPEANVARVKQELSEHGVVSSEWGGETEFVEVSALTGKGIEELLEAILLQAEVMDLKIDEKAPARAVVIESRLDQHVGAIADLIIQNGTLRLGDSFTVGNLYGRVRSIINDRGEKLKEASFSMPVQISGIERVPYAGDVLEVHASEKEAKKIAEMKKLESEAKSEIYTTHISANEKELNLIVKADSQGTLEAVKASLMKITNEEVKLIIVHSSTGAITPSDLKLADATKASIVTFNIPVTGAARKEAQLLKINIDSYDVIYKLIEDIEEKLKAMMEVKYEFVYRGKAEVLKVFKISKVGTVAGCVVKDGHISNKSYLKVKRGEEIIKEGNILSLKREKDFISKAEAGQECGIIIQNYHNFEVGDIIEAYNKEAIPG